MNASPTCQPVPAPQGCLIWLVDLRQPDADPEQVLSAAEQARASRFRFERDARRYRVSHLALRHILATQLNCHPAQLQFETGVHGKPRLVPGAWHFNLSHSDDWALVALHPERPVGVDLEYVQPMADWALLAQQNYTPQENQALQALPRDQQQVAFLRCWTRKEACLKALGSGLLIEPQVFEAGVAPHPASVAIPLPDGPPCLMEVCSFPLNAKGQPDEGCPPLLLGALALVEPHTTDRVF